MLSIEAIAEDGLERAGSLPEPWEVRATEDDCTEYFKCGLGEPLLELAMQAWLKPRKIGVVSKYGSDQVGWGGDWSLDEQLGLRPLPTFRSYRLDQVSNSEGLVVGQWLNRFDNGDERIRRSERIQVGERSKI
jgi:hypothetical protein